MAKKEIQCCEKFKTMIGGQALIEGIMMRGPEKDAIVIRTGESLTVEVSERKLNPPKSYKNWPFLRGMFNFFDAQVTGVKALMQSADLAPEEMQDEPSKFDLWLEKKLGSEKFQKALIGFSVALGLCMCVALFILLPSFLVGFLDQWITHPVLQNLIEGCVRVLIFTGYMLLVSRMNEMKRVFAYHGAEHKTIRCYEAGLPLTVENVRKMTRLHPRCGTSFLLVVVVLSIILFSVVSTGLLNLIPALAAIKGTIGYRFIMMAIKLLLLPVLVSLAYEINRLVGRHDNWFTKIIMAPGLWMQRITTNEPDDEMIEVGIAAVEAVLPSKEGADRW